MARRSSSNRRGAKMSRSSGDPFLDKLEIMSKNDLNLLLDVSIQNFLKAPVDDHIVELSDMIKTYDIWSRKVPRRDADWNVKKNQKKRVGEDYY